MNKSKLLFPIRVSLFYLFSTYALFLFGGISNGVDNIEFLTFYVFVVYFGFYFGYRFAVELNPHSGEELNLIKRKVLYVRWLTYAGALYMFVWGVNQILDFGGSGLYDIFLRILNPGDAYAAKFDIYDSRIAENKINRVTQILVLFSVIFSMSLPVFFAYKKNIARSLRFAYYFCVFVYAVSFLYIGTQKGLADIVILGAAGWVASRIRENSSGLVVSFRSIFYLLVVFGLVFLYMVLNQASRVETFGLTSTLMTQNVDLDNSVVTFLFGRDFANGLYIILGYPTHGYIGLSHNLGQDYVFSYGAGFSQAFESYRFQLFGGDNNLLLTYPYRTEAATGWPAGMYWATALPWFASDLTFFGVIPFVFLVGFLFAKIWVSCLQRMDFISLAALGQIFMFVAFLPANNQVLMSRQGLITVVALIFLKVFLIFSARTGSGAR